MSDNAENQGDRSASFSAETTYEFTPALMRAGAKRLVMRQRRWLVAWTIIIAALLAKIAFMGFDLVSLIPVVVGSLYLLAALGWIYFAGSSAQSMPVTLRVANDSFTVELPEYTSTCKWSVFKKIHRFHDLWVVELSVGGQDTVIPTRCLTQELQDHVIERVRDAGGEVT